MSRINDSVAKHKALLKLQEMVKRQENILVHLQSIMIAQSKEVSELKVTLERQTCYTTSSSELYAQPPIVRADPVSTQVSLNVFKFTKYAERKSSNAAVFSPPFYSSPGGCKLCIKVYANGNGKGKGTHVSVFAFLMRGDNDDHLPWPFTGTVDIELLNQLKDDFHNTVHAVFENSDGKRILDGDRAKNGFGRQKYISHLSFDFIGNPVHQCQFLKDDCLYFRMKVDCTSTPKPWLSSANEF